LPTNRNRRANSTSYLRRLRALCLHGAGGAYERWSQPAFGDPIVADGLLADVSGRCWWHAREFCSNRIRRLWRWTSKNAILIVEFAKQAQDEGASVELRRYAPPRTVCVDPDDRLGLHPQRCAACERKRRRAPEKCANPGPDRFFGMLGVTVFGLRHTHLLHGCAVRLPKETAARAGEPHSAPRRAITSKTKQSVQ